MTKLFNKFKVSIIVIIIAILIILTLTLFCSKSNNKLKYIAFIQPHNKKSKYKNIRGKIFFEELDNGLTKIHGQIDGLKPGKHGIHIHESGDLSKGCKSLRGHYNPYNKNHGARIIKKENKIITNYNRHVGDLGNLVVSPCGNCSFSFTDELIKLRGQTNILGRSVIIHDQQDDLGLGDHDDSKITGHAGKRIACGIIGIA